MPSVLKMQIQTNHGRCPFLPALHNATPFHAADQIERIKNRQNPRRGRSTNKDGIQFIGYQTSFFETKDYTYHGIMSKQTSAFQ